MFHHEKCPGTFRTARPLILASASPRRKELLSSAGIEFVIEPSGAEEPAPGSGDDPLSYAASNAMLKASEVAARFPGSAVLGADTIVVLDDEILGKPSDESHAIEMLTSLCGRRHTVITACCLLGVTGGEVMFDSATDVWLDAQDARVIRAYVKSGEPLDKAGSYAVQGGGAFMVSRLEGSYTNVVGLPMEKVIPVLLEHHVITVKV